MSEGWTWSEARRAEKWCDGEGYQNGAPVCDGRGQSQGDSRQLCQRCQRVPSFVLVPIESTGTRRTMAHVNRGPGKKSGFEYVDFPVYPPNPKGEELRDLRVEWGIGLRQVSSLERGSARLATDAEWTRAYERIVTFAKQAGNTFTAREKK